MKKIVALVMTVSLLLSALCVTALAADTPTGPVLRVSGEIEGGDGSLSMVVAILALAASIAAIGVSISSNKKIVSAKSGEAREDKE